MTASKYFLAEGTTRNKGIRELIRSTAMNVSARALKRQAGLLIRRKKKTSHYKINNREKSAEKVSFEKVIKKVFFWRKNIVIVPLKLIKAKL